MERLQKILSRAGVASRRAAEELIRQGRVSVNGTVVDVLGAKADPARDEITVDGERVQLAKRIYLVAHKPPGMVTTLHDPEGRPTIRDLLPEGLDRVFPVGRLDFGTRGVVLLTNDGELASRLLHPRYGVPRTYKAKVFGRPDEKALRRLRQGIRIEPGLRTGPAEVKVDEGLPKKTWVTITIREGRRREIRRMCEAVGHPVDRLIRERFGPLELGSMPPGAVRPLSSKEVQALRRAAGLGRRKLSETKRSSRRVGTKATAAGRQRRRS